MSGSVATICDIRPTTGKLSLQSLFIESFDQGHLFTLKLIDRSADKLKQASKGLHTNKEIVFDNRF